MLSYNYILASDVFSSNEVVKMPYNFLFKIL